MSSTSLDYPVSSLQEDPRPNGQVLTPRRGGHDIPSAVRLPDHRWRHDLALGLEVQGGESAHPSAATRHRACHVVGPVTPIRMTREANAGGRKAAGNRDIMTGPSAGRSRITGRTGLLPDLKGC